MAIKTLGIDLGKSVFQLVGQDARGNVVLRKRMSRKALITFTANLPSCLIGMEASCGAHHMARVLLAQGHEVKLMPAAYVRAYVKSHKNDDRDAEGACEAVQRPTMRFVPPKSTEQLDGQAMHRLRTRLIKARTALINQMRAFLLERGITVGKGPGALRRKMPDLLADEDRLSPGMRLLLQGMAAEWHELDDKIAAASAALEKMARTSERCRLMMTAPGIGPLIATGTVAAVGDGSAFKRGRDFGAWLGMVPRQDGTGGRIRLGPITKRGNAELRRLFIQGARSLLSHLDRRTDALGDWIRALLARKPHSNVVVVALANKLARIAWAILRSGEAYRADRAAA